jgi:hypothetical protein
MILLVQKPPKADLPMSKMLLIVSIIGNESRSRMVAEMNYKMDDIEFLKASKSQVNIKQIFKCE